MKKKIAHILWVLMDKTCSALGHRGVCGMLNYEWYFGYSNRIDDYRIIMRNPFYRVYRWAERTN